MATKPTTVDRDKFRPKKNLHQMKKKLEDAETEFGAKFNRTNNLKIENGKNKIRFVRHPEDDHFIVKKVVHWAEVETDDGERKRFPILNSRAHGNTEKDIFDEYIKYVRARVATGDVEDGDDKLKLLVDYKRGIGPSTKDVVLAFAINGDKKEFGELDLNYTIAKSIKDEMFIEDDDDPVEADPFTDPDDGKPVIIEYNEKTKKKTEKYKVKLAKPLALTDDDLDQIGRAKSLTAMYGGSAYTMRTFERALEAVKIFDEDNEFEFFEDDDFQAIIEEVRAQYPDDSDDDDDKPKKKGKGKKSKSSAKPAKGKPTKKSTSKDDDDDDDEDDQDDQDEDEEEEKPKAKAKPTKAKPEPAPTKKKKVTDDLDDKDRDELKEVISEEELDDVKIKKSMTEDDIRAAIRTARAEKVDSSDDEDDDEDEDSDDDEDDDAEFDKVKERLKAKGKKK